jgi:hypothetical protein
MCGGPGGFAAGKLAVASGTELLLVPGLGGIVSANGGPGTAPRPQPPSGRGGSGGAGRRNHSGGTGGGGSLVYARRAGGGYELLCVAGGGGGSAVHGDSGGFGGAGGGQAGVGSFHRSGAKHQPAKGGTQTQPGTPVAAGGAAVDPVSAATFGQGGGGVGAGDAQDGDDCGGGGGGGGYFGGAGGSTDDGGSSGGGGGSGFVHPTATEPALETAGVWADATNDSSAYYPPHRQGSGGAYSQLHRGRAGEPALGEDGNGNHGLVLVLDASGAVLQAAGDPGTHPQGVTFIVP